MSIFSQLSNLKGNLNALQDNLEQKTIRVTMNEDAIVVRLNGLLEVLEISLDPAKLPWNDPAKVAELLAKTFNGAVEEARQLAKDELKNQLGGINLPGLDDLFD